MSVYLWWLHTKNCRTNNFSPLTHSLTCVALFTCSPHSRPADELFYLRASVTQCGANGFLCRPSHPKWCQKFGRSIGPSYSIRSCPISADTQVCPMSQSWLCICSKGKLIVNRISRIGYKSFFYDHF